MKRFISIILIICALTLCFASCGDSKKIQVRDTLVDEWEFTKHVNGDVAITREYIFRLDGTYRLKASENIFHTSSVVEGTYTITDDSIECVLGSEYEGSIREYSLSYTYENKKLTLTDDTIGITITRDYKKIDN